MSLTLDEAREILSPHMPEPIWRNRDGDIIPSIETFAQRTKRRTERAKALGFWEAYKALHLAEINLDAFMRGMIDLDGARHYAAKARAAAELVEAILAQVDE